MCVCVRPAADGKKRLPFSDTLVFCGGFDDVSSVFHLLSFFLLLYRVFLHGSYFPRRKEKVETPGLSPYYLGGGGEEGLGIRVISQMLRICIFRPLSWSVSPALRGPLPGLLWHI